jgi:hypothetical protein
VAGSGNLTLQHLTLRGGIAVAPAGDGDPPSQGGAIFDRGALTVSNSTLAGNFAILGGGIYAADGPWPLLLLLLGFLPFSEVSCNAQQFSLRLTQSGYQAVYGGVTAPLGVEEAVQDQKARMIERGNSQTYTALSKQARSERSDFLMSCSPFLATFWVGNLALVAVITLMRVGHSRLGVFLGICSLMLLMLLLQLALGTPLERRASHAVAEAIRENPEDGMRFAVGFSAGKTLWYWVAVCAVFLAASAEVVAWLVGRARFHKTPVSVPVILGASFVAACVTALLLQYGLWEAGLTALEAQAAKIRQAEEERTAKIRQAEEERVAKEEAERVRQRAQMERESWL